MSAYLQDAVLPVSEMSFEAKEHRFVAVFSRFRWELLQNGRSPDKGEDGEPLYQRVHTALRCENVEAVRSTNLDRRQAGTVLNLLAVRASDDPNDLFVDLVFANGVTIRLDVSSLSCHVEDLGEPWATPFLPRHEDEPAEQ